MLLSKFSNEVLSQGAASVLPQNLSDPWLKRLQKLSDDFLDHNFTIDQCTESLDEGDPIISTCVHEILRTNGDMDEVITSDLLAEKSTIYALSITMETIRRESGMEMVLPTMENLLSIGRIVQFGKINPQFARFLKDVCILPESEKDTSTEESWFQRLKKKIRSRMASLP